MNSHYKKKQIKDLDSYFDANIYEKVRKQCKIIVVYKRLTLTQITRFDGFYMQVRIKLN